jgi:hypothetical protein
MTRLHAEIGRSINFYRTQQGGGAPARVLLSGGSSIIPYTDRFFHEKIQVPVEYFNPFRNVELDPSISREQLAKSAHFFGEVVGLGLRELTECPLEVNLLPASLKSRRSGEQKRPYLAATALCILLIPLSLWAFHAKVAAIRAEELNDVRTLADQYDRTKREIEDETAQLQAVKQKADKVLAVVGQRSHWPMLLEDLNQRLDKVPLLWITRLTPVQRGPGMEAEGAPTGRRGQRGIPPGALPPGMMRAPPVTDGGSPGGSTVMELLIAGEGIHNFNNPAEDLALVEQLAEELRASPFFDKDGVEITEPPPAMTDKDTFPFALRARLAKPVTP